MKPEIINGFKFQKGVDGSKKLIIESSNLDACVSYILENNIKSISINSYQGYDLPNIDFLSELSGVLEGLHLPETKFDNNVLNSLHNLKYLGFADNKRDIIDLSNFPNLESLACDYSSRLEGLLTCEKLKDLTLTGYKSKSNHLSELSSLFKLETLNLFKTNITSLQGIEHLTNLKSLELFRATKLININALHELSKTLEVIQIEQCKKIRNFDVLGEIQSLKKIILSESGEIKTLSFIKELPSLEFLSFWGTKVLDGDISYCKGLKYVGFDNKKHYSHKTEYFTTGLG